MTFIDEDGTPKIQWGKGVEENMTDNDHDAGNRKKLPSASQQIMATKQFLACPFINQCCSTVKAQLATQLKYILLPSSAQSQAPAGLK